jgi:D-lactate dehydrogenase (cytochrome)
MKTLVSALLLALGLMCFGAAFAQAAPDAATAVAAAAEDIREAGLIGPMVGHVGDGNFHSQMLIMPGNADELAAAKRVATRMAERALAVGGTITGEHGVGIGKRSLMRAQHGDAIGVMAAIKTALDPQGIMNPGKMLPDVN